MEGDVKKVFWKAVAGKDNSKRNDPTPGWIDPKTKKPAALKDGVGEFESDVVDGKAKASFCLGLAGGEEFTFEAGSSKGKKELEQKVVNWRRLWYQLTHHKDITPPSMATAVKQLEDVFIEWVAEPAVKHSLAPKGEVIVGRHNAEEYHKLLATKHAGQCAHIILCDYQYDGVRPGGGHYTAKSSEQFTSAKDTITVSDDAGKLKVLNPPLPKGAKLLLDGTWSNASTGKSGKLTDDPAKLDNNTGLANWKDRDTFEVELPKNATPSAKTPVTVALHTTAASGPWGGDGGTAPHNLVVINGSDVIHTQVVLHELGHIINMVPIAGSYKAPPGMKLSEHSLSYTGMGGAGSHCSWEIDKTKSTATRNVDGKCIMFHQLNYNCKLVYCPDCAPFVKAQSLLVFHDLKG